MLDASRDKMSFQLNGVGPKAMLPLPYPSVQSRLVNGGVTRKRQVGNGIRIAVMPFLDASGGDSSNVYAQLITDELIHELARTAGVRVSAASSVAPLIAKTMDMRSLARKLDVQIIFEGTVRQVNNLIRIMSRVVNAADGFQIWSERVDAEPDLQDLPQGSERIASSLVSPILQSNG